MERGRCKSHKKGKRTGNIYIKQEIHFSTYKLKHYNVSSKNLEVMWIEIHMVNSKKIIIGNLYRPSQGDSNICCEYLTDTVNDIVQGNNADLFLLGDFNVD